MPPRRCSRRHADVAAAPLPSPSVAHHRATACSPSPGCRRCRRDAATSSWLPLSLPLSLPGRRRHIALQLSQQPLRPRRLRRIVAAAVAAVTSPQRRRRITAATVAAERPMPYCRCPCRSRRRCVGAATVAVVVSSHRKITACP